MSKSRFLKDIGIYGLGDFILHAISFFTFPIFTRVFTVSQYGIIELVTSICSIVAVIINCGLNNACQRYYLEPGNGPKEERDIVSTGLILLVSLSIIITALCITGTFFIQDFIESSYSIPWVVLSIALISNIPLQIVQYSQDLVRIYFQPIKFTVISFIKNIGTVSAQLILVIICGFGLFGYFFGNMVILFLILPLSIYFIKKDLQLHFNRKISSELIEFGYPFIFTNIAYWLFSSVDRWLLAEFSDLTQVGLYSIGFKICTVLIFINMAFGQAWTPYALKLYSDDADYKRIYGEILVFWIYILIIIASLIGMFSFEILNVLCPPNYWDAALIISILAFGIVVSGTMQITAIGISLEKKTKIFSYISWSAAFLNIVLNVLLIPDFGAMGAAIATLIAYIYISAAYFYFTQRYHPIIINEKHFSAVILLYFISLAMVLVTFTPSISTTHIIIKSIYILFLGIAGLILGIIPRDFISNIIQHKLIMRR